jgi:hypothetical protein
MLFELVTWIAKIEDLIPGNRRQRVNGKKLPIKGKKSLHCDKQAELTGIAIQKETLRD